MTFGTARIAFAGLTAVLGISVALLATGGPGNLFAGDNREDTVGSTSTTLTVECDDDGTWQVYAPIAVDAAKVNGAVVVEVDNADRIAITDAVVDNGFVDGVPAKIAPGVADVLFKDGGAATNDPIILEMTAPVGHTAVSNFVTPIKVSGTTLGLKSFREAPTTLKKNVAVTVAGTCE